MSAPRITCVVGTRPEVIKMAPVIERLRATRRYQLSVLGTGQHRDLLRPLLDWFNLETDLDLKVMTEDQTLAGLTARLVEALDAHLAQTTPDLVLVQGDTTTVMCAGLACFYRGIALAHVEAGLRTHDLTRPFPEEFNRVAVSRIARLHFCPTAGAAANLRGEGVAAAGIHVTGNTVIDALLDTARRLDAAPVEVPPADILVTAHRRESFGAPLEGMLRALREVVDAHPATSMLYPVHPNPRVRDVAHRLLGGHPRIRLTAPLAYPELVQAMRQARFVLTDSGGIQEEAPALGKPVLVLRDTTERPEAVALGVARVVGTDRARIVEECRRLLTEPAHYQAMAQGVSPYGDGHAAERIAAIVAGNI